MITTRLWRRATQNIETKTVDNRTFGEDLREVLGWGALLASAYLLPQRLHAWFHISMPLAFAVGIWVGVELSLVIEARPARGRKRGFWLSTAFCVLVYVVGRIFNFPR